MDKSRAVIGRRRKDGIICIVASEIQSHMHIYSIHTSVSSNNYSRIQLKITVNEMGVKPEQFERMTQNKALKIFSRMLRGGSSGLSVSSIDGMP